MEKLSGLIHKRVMGLLSSRVGPVDVFVHITAVQNSGLDGLSEGQAISFDLEEGQNGKTSAVNFKSSRTPRLFFEH